jgi:hypothetical protein
LAVGALTYVAGYLACPPRIIHVADEAAYVRQAVAFAAGSVTVVEADAMTGAERRVAPSRYPPGTSAIQAPMVWIGGWRAASFASVLSLLAALGLLARWLLEGGRSPLYALLLLGYAPALVMGRIAMSDAPSAFVTVLFLASFWRDDGRATLAAGLVAGLSLLFRETNAVIPAVFVIGSLARRERRAPRLLLGAVLGVAAYLAVSAAVFGSPFFVRDPGHGLSLAAVLRNAPLYLFALLVMVPGGLAAGLFYRGPRRAEVVGAVAAYVLVYLAYDYGGELTGGVKRLAVGPRYFIPLVPLLAWAMSDVAPRARDRLESRLPRRPATTGPVSALVWTWAAGVVVAAAVVHPVMDAWGRSQLEVVRALFGHTGEGAPVITNAIATSRFLADVYGKRLVVPHHRIRPEDVPTLLERHGRAYVAFLERVDHAIPERWRHETLPFVDALQELCDARLVHQADYQGTGSLRIWKLVGCDR